MSERKDTYEKPDVRDYGDLVELTQATGLTGAEDGGSKAEVHHSAPATP